MERIFRVVKPNSSLFNVGSVVYLIHDCGDGYYLCYGKIGFIAYAEQYINKSKLKEIYL